MTIKIGTLNKFSISTKSLKFKRGRIENNVAKTVTKSMDKIMRKVLKKSFLLINKSPQNHQKNYLRQFLFSDSLQHNHHYKELKSHLIIDRFHVETSPTLEA